MKDMDSRAKKEVIEELLKMISDSGMEDMKSVQVSAADDKSLLKGLDEAKNIVGEKKPSSAVLEDEVEVDDDDEIAKLEEELRRLRSKRR